jgi:glycosyltransferase involved in cell wall biosynthesis
MPMDETRFLFLYSSIYSPVFESEGMRMLHFLKKWGYMFDIVLFRGFRSQKSLKRDKKKAKNIETELGCRVVSRLTPRPNNFPGLQLQRWWLKRFVHHELKNGSKVLIHALTHFPAQAAINLSKFNNVKFIFSPRGEYAEELLYLNGKGDLSEEKKLEDPQYLSIKRIERQNIIHADKIVAVSRAHKLHLMGEYNLPSDKIFVIPLLADDELFKRRQMERKKMRKFLGVQKKIVFVFCGSLHRWQMIQESIEIFRLLLYFRRDIHFLLLTKKACSAKAMFSDLPEGTYSVISSPFEEVGKYLEASDLGLLLRENHVVNRVASPTKFAEYLLCGLPVVISPWVGDFSELVEAHRLGLVINPMDKEEAAVMISSFIDKNLPKPEYLRSWAVRNMTWNAYKDRIDFLYKETLCKPT